jgi:hypothetical protein
MGMPIGHDKLPQDWQEEADVVIVGYGGAGAVAAITAHDSSAEVIILEKLPADLVDDQGNIIEIRHTPTSRMSGGLIQSPNNPEEAFKYQKAMNESYGLNDVPDETLLAYVRGISENEAWLRNLQGSEAFYEGPEEGPLGIGGPLYPHLPGASSVRRLLHPQAGYGFFDCLQKNVAVRGIRVMYESPVTQLVQDPITRRVLGVLAEHGGAQVAVRARKAVILTCGGFEFDMKMQANYLRVWPFRFYGNPGNTGDGVRMGMRVGADLWHMNNVSGNASSWWPDAPYTFYCTPWHREVCPGSQFRDGTPIPEFKSSYSVIIVDRWGRRFTQEVYKPYTFYWKMIEFDTLNAEFPRIPSHMIFDEKTRVEGPVVSRSGAAGPIKLYEWSHDNSLEIAKGWIKKADTVQDLAKVIGVPPGNLEETVQRWNSFCQEGKDLEHGRDPKTLVPLDTPPFYEVILWPGSANTLGGPRRNHEAQVVDPDGNPIPGLYSSGELGSLYGFLYQGGGNLAECIAFGRISGRNAAREHPNE